MDGAGIIWRVPLASSILLGIRVLSVQASSDNLSSGSK